MSILTKEKLKKTVTSPSRIAIIVAVVLIVASIVRRITGADDITSAGATGATLRFTIPLLMAGLGGLWAERSGVINIGLEGMMIAGTWLGAWFGFLHGPLVGFICAAIGGALIGLFHGFLVVKIGIDQAVSGLAINLLALGTARYLSSIYFAPNGGDISLSPQVKQPGVFSVPILSSFLADLNAKNIIVISDAAGILGGFVTEVSYATVLLFLLVPISTWLLWRTRFGLRLRFCGENPVAAESLGVKVFRTRYIALAISGMFASLGGAYLCMVSASVYREGQTAGRGFIGLATVIFGNWRPTGVLAGSFLFGFTDALRVRQSTSVHAILLVIVILVLLFAMWKLFQRNYKVFGISALSSLIVGVIFLKVPKIPDEFVTFFPNLATILVLVLLAQKLRPPAMLAVPFREREEGH